jgi:hypothetical protein
MDGNSSIGCRTETKWFGQKYNSRPRMETKMYILLFSSKIIKYIKGCYTRE